MKKLITILLLVASSAFVQAQPLLLKQYDGEGSCWTVRSIFFEFPSNRVTVQMDVFADYIAFRKNNTKPENTHSYEIHGNFMNSLRDSVVLYLKNNEQWFSSSLLTNVSKLPSAPDTVWCNISNSFKDTSIHRSIGVYSFWDNPLAKICGIAGTVKYRHGDTILFNLTNEITWTLDNTDSVYDPNFGWVHSYDYFKGAQQYYHWDNTTTIQQGIHWADPGKINDRLKY